MSRCKPLVRGCSWWISCNSKGLTATTLAVVHLARRHSHESPVPDNWRSFRFWLEKSISVLRVLDHRVSLGLISLPNFFLLRFRLRPHWSCHTYMIATANAYYLTLALRQPSSWQQHCNQSQTSHCRSPHDRSGYYTDLTRKDKPVTRPLAKK